MLAGTITASTAGFGIEVVTDTDVGDVVAFAGSIAVVGFLVAEPLSAGAWLALFARTMDCAFALGECAFEVTAAIGFEVVTHLDDFV